MPERDCSLLVMDAIEIGVDIAMVCVGISYMDQKYCKVGAPTYLLVAGLLSLIATVIRFLAYLVKEYAKKDGEASLREHGCRVLMCCTSLLVMACNFVVLIWGSVVIFGKYGSWHTSISRMNDVPGYCAYTPMMFAFVILIIKWVTLPVSILVVCFGVVCMGKSVQIS